jgi:hypothetical protein
MRLAVKLLVVPLAVGIGAGMAFAQAPRPARSTTRPARADRGDRPATQPADRSGVPSAESLLPPESAAPAVPATRPARPATQPARGATAAAPGTTRPSQLSAEEMLGQLLKPPPGGGGADGVDETGNTLPPGGLHEGTYVRNVVGKLVRRKDSKGVAGEPEFVVDGRNGGPPLVLMPSLTLMMVEDAMANTNREVKFRVSGTVTEYKGKNYLLPEQVSRGGKPMTESVPPLAADKTSGGGAVKPNAPVLNVMREGTYLVDRVGRLTRSPDGTQFELTFDSDGRAMRDPPLIVLPGLKLWAMENATTGHNKDPRFRVTGLVTEYRGRNYFLPEKVVAIPDVVQQF